MRRNSLYFSIVFVFLSMLCSFAYAQPTWTFDPFGKEKKPEEYVERKLPSEKTADKKFTRVRQFIQNTTTHYNFYFNANNKLNTVIENAKFSQVDDYSNLISFYPYSLENTASQSVELDSVIFKSTGGILLHDLRSDWVDNMYLLIGKAYYFKKVFDSAALTFQFINYNLFPREKNEDDSRVVGTNSSGSTTKLSIANREKRNFIKRVLSMPPSRNEALIWQARTYIESNMYGEAAGLINILQEDPNLPKRLKDDLNQVTAFWYYKQEGYDSAAVYLEKGLSSADNKSDKCRWEFLLGQLFDMNGQFDKANDYYLAAAKNTVDPLMDIYARLNKAKLLRNSGNAKELENSISLLLRMAKRDKYETYKDIIYHSAGLLTLQKPDTVNAIALLEKSLKLNENNVAYKNKTHLALGRIAFKQRNYKVAADHYDSLDVSEKAILKDSVEVADRKSSLRQIAVQLNIIEREDSLQKIASLSPEQRDQFIKKLIKKHKKEQGVKEEETIAPENLLSSFDNGKNSVAIDLFSNSTKGGEWYFYNSSMKSKGFSEFKSKWGKRDNTDNWRIKSSSRLSNKKGIDNLNGDPMAPQEPSVDSATGKPVDFSYDALMLNVPTTEDKMDSSNFYIQNALMELARVFQFELKDYHQALETYAVLMKRYPDKLFLGELYLGLYYCYTKVDSTEKAAYYKKLLDADYTDSKFAKMINDPESLQPEKNNSDVQKRYLEIYDLFLREKYDSAIEMKMNADVIYGYQYWTPQLLYIEAMYYIKCTTDSEGIATLNRLVEMYPESPLKDKALRLIEVLGRKHDVETYLTDLKIKRYADDDKIIMPNERSAQMKTTDRVPPSVPQMKEIKTVPRQKDSSIQLPPTSISGVYRWQPSKPHSVIMILDKVDPVYVNETKNAYNRFNGSINMSRIKINKDTLDQQRNLLVFSVFESAEESMSYFDKIKKAASVQVSWLQPSKYSFLIIDDENLQLLKRTKNIEDYKKLLNIQYPGKF